MRLHFSLTVRNLIAVPVLLAATAIPSFAGGPRIHRGPTSPKLFKERAKAGHPKATTTASMEPERAAQIQTALIKAGYLNGAPSGQWDSQTQAAMQKMQADNGWQTKIVPDSRAIIKLGLGPGTEGEAVAAEATQAPATESSPEGAALPSSK